MSSELRKEIERLSLEIENLKKDFLAGKKKSTKLKIQRYHALLERISKSPEVDTTPDELISSLQQKEY